MEQDHGITNPDQDDFTIETQQSVLSLLGNITNILTLFLAAIASISLVVGGIGIMNIMLVSVIERTKEIGLRKSVGATNKDILQQFLVESVMLTFIGGMIGIAVGAFVVGLAWLVITKVAGVAWTFEFPLSAILLAVAVSSITGIAFGIYPAQPGGAEEPDRGASLRVIKNPPDHPEGFLSSMRAPFFALFFLYYRLFLRRVLL